MKKKKGESIFTKPLLARVTVPVLAAIVIGLSVYILRQPPLKGAFRPALSNNGQPVVALFLEEPPAKAKDNAAYYYQKAYIQLIDLFKSDKLGQTDEELVKEAGSALELFTQGTRLRQCDFSFNGEMKIPPSTFRKAISRVFLSQIIFMKTDLLINSGRVDEALEWYRRFFVYLAHLSSQKNLSAEAELIAGKQTAAARLRELIETGRLSVVQGRALLAFLLDLDRSETPFSATIVQAGEEMKGSLTGLPKDIADRYARIADDYFKFLCLVLDSPDAAGMGKAAEKRGSLSSFDAQLVKAAKFLVSRSNIDRKSAQAYLSAAKVKTRMYDDVARIVFILTCPSPDILYGDYFTAVAEWRLLETALAAKLYRAESNRNPASPADLVPRFLPHQLKDPFAEAGFSLEDNGGIFTVSSGREGLEITPQ